MKENFCESMNALFSSEAVDLKMYTDGSQKIFIIDENENRIYTFPVLECEEKYLYPDDSECFVWLSICCNGQQSDKLQIKSTDLYNGDAYIKKFGNKPFKDFAKNEWKLFFKTSQVMLAQIEQREVYMYSGWTKDLKRFLYGDRLIDEYGVAVVKSALVKNSVILSDLSDKEVVGTVDSIVSRLCNKKLIGYMMLMHLFLSFEKQRVVITYGISPEYVLEIVGKTGSYKTTTSIGMYNTIDCSVSSFEDTIASIRRMFQANRSGITIVDDYKIQTPKNDEKFEKVVRLSGDVNTTSKYVSGNKVVDELVTGMGVITGEKRPILQTSSYSRILFVDLNNNPINISALTQLQESKAEINSLVILFLQYILQNGDFDEKLVALFHEYRDAMLKKPQYAGMHMRYYSMYAWLAAIWQVYTELAGSYGVDVDYNFAEEAENYIYEQHCHYDNDPVKLFHTGYLELLNANELTVVSNEGIEDVNFDVVEYDNRLFIKSNTVYKKVCAFWLAKGIEFPCSERKLRQHLLDSDILVPDKGRVTVEKKTKTNRSFSGYYLLKNTFIKYGGKNYEESE